MTNPAAARQEPFCKTEFDLKVAALQAARSCAAEWLTDFRDSLARIFGLDPTNLWEHLGFHSGIYLMVRTSMKMTAKGLLPLIPKFAYEQAKQEWEGPEARAMVSREWTFAKNTSLSEVIDDFEAARDGVPEFENEGARAHCRNELAKLFRMVRLSR